MLALIGVIVATLLVALLSLWIAWRLSRSLAKAVFGSDITSTVFGLGLAVWCFPEMLRAPLNIISRTAVSLFSSIPRELTPLIRGDLSANSPQLANVLQKVGNILADIFVFGTFPITDVALGFSMWILVARLTEGVFTGTHVEGVAKRFRAYLGTLTPVARNNAALFTILFVGCYLSIAAIVAIPWLQQTNVPTEIDAEHLNAALKEAGLSQTQFDEQFPKELRDSNPFASARRILGVEPMPSGKEQPPAASAGGNTGGTPSTEKAQVSSHKDAS